MTAYQYQAPNLSNFPTELIALPRWVLWKAVPQGVGMKPRKLPMQANGKPASSTNPDTWTDFATAKAAYEQGGYTGQGIVLAGDGLAGVDIDNCRDKATGRIDPAATAILDNLGAAYIEVSPSGTGLRAFGYAANLDRGAKGKLDGVDLELYSTGRFLTLTGSEIKRGPLTALDGFDSLAQRLRPAKCESTPASPASAPETPIEGNQNAELIRRIISGHVYHDSLRDLAASYAASGMAGGAIVNQLRALMECSTAPHDDRWKARMA